jgi:hypothetical protein
MLTITEATDAIRALDTSADVIRGACRRFLELEDEDKKIRELDADGIYRHMLDTYYDAVSSPHVLMSAAIMLAARIGGATVKLEKAVESPKSIFAFYRMMFFETLMLRLHDELKGPQPEKAKQTIISLLEHILNEAKLNKKDAERFESGRDMP